MNQIEVKKVLKLIGGMFPGRVTEEQMIALADRLRQFSYVAAAKAVNDHCFNHEFLSFPQLIEGCRSAEQTSKLSPRQNFPSMSFADIYRRQRPDLTDANDFEVVIRVHRSWWISQTRTAPLRAKLERSCAAALISVGMPANEALQWVAYIFLDSTECQDWLNTVRQMQPAQCGEQRAA